MTQVLLCPNPHRDHDLELTRTVGRLVADHGGKVFLPSELSCEGMEGAEFLPMERALVRAAFMIVLGGDGTILHAARSAARHSLPILGINIGNKGFMAELERDELSLIPLALDGKASVDRRMMLDLTVMRDGREAFCDLALNDVVLTKGAIARAIDITVLDEGDTITSFTGDGLVIATPTGSTAYSMSAGGPIVEPRARNIILTPICAHLLRARSFVLPGERVITLPAPVRESYLSVDGGDAFALQEGDLVLIQRSPLETQLLRMKNKSFYDIINHKLR